MNHVQAKSGQVQDKAQKVMTLEDAAKVSGASVDALRKRLQRGIEDGYKGNDGKWRVYVNPDWTANKPSPGSSGQILEQLLDQIRKRDTDKDRQIAHLTSQIDEKDAVIRELIQRLPTPQDELEALQKKLDSQEAIVKRAYGVLKEQLKADVA